MDSSDLSTTASDEAPEWLNEALIEEALVNDKVTNAKVTSISVSRATAPGDNYASIIYRVTATLDDGEQRTMLVKVPPAGEIMGKAVIESGLFRTEAFMLSNILPKMKDLLDHASPGFPAFGARCPLHANESVPFVFLEDLKPHGFQVANRHRGLGLRHCLVAIRSLARFHAASVALLAEDPNITNILGNPFLSSENEGFILSFFEMTQNVCKKWPDYEEYVGILENFKLRFMEALRKMNDPNPTGFNVIIHGDFWTNNMMFKYDENDHVEDYRMVDLQISHVTSPAIDLLYFFNTSVSEDVYEHHQQLLMREYHNTLREILDLLGIPGPSFKELMEDINAHGPYALFGALGVWPITRAKSVPDLEAQATGDSNKSNFMYETEEAKKWLQRVLPDFKSKGWLELPE